MSTLDGRYDLGDRIGGGATADVYRAHDTRLGRDVAVKVFRRASALPDARGRLESEVRLLASLSHPNLVALYDAEVGDEPYVVMELVEGASLHDVMTAGPVEPSRVARLGAEISAALAYVHSRGVVHRDVKPGNVLLTPDDHAKVADFGIARLVDDAGMTQAGLVVGTAAYLAPEQVQGRQLTTSADVYSLGLVLLEALTGHREYDGPATEAAGARLHRAPTIPTSLGAGWTSLLAAMTATDPAARPGAGEVSSSLRAFAEPGSTAATRAIVAPPPATAVLPPVVDPVLPPPRRRGWGAAAVLLGLLAVAAAVVAIVLATRHTGTPASTPTTTPSSTATTSSSSSAPPTTSTSEPPTTTSSSAAPNTTSTSASPTPTTPSTTPTTPSRSTTAPTSSATSPAADVTSSPAPPPGATSPAAVGGA